MLFESRSYEVQYEAKEYENYSMLIGYENTSFNKRIVSITYVNNRWICPNVIVELMTAKSVMAYTEDYEVMVFVHLYEITEKHTVLKKLLEEVKRTSYKDDLIVEIMLEDIINS